MHVHAITFFITGPPQLPNDADRHTRMDVGKMESTLSTLDVGSHSMSPVT